LPKVDDYLGLMMRLIFASHRVPASVILTLLGRVGIITRPAQVEAALLHRRRFVIAAVLTPRRAQPDVACGPAAASLRAFGVVGEWVERKAKADKVKADAAAAAKPRNKVSRAGTTGS